MKLSKTNYERQPLAGPRDARKRIKKRKRKKRERTRTRKRERGRKRTSSPRVVLDIT